MLLGTTRMSPNLW